MCFSAETFFRASILIYLISAVTSLVFIKRQKVCNILVNVMCILAAILGAAASILQIFSKTDRINIGVVKSIIPFIDIALKVDNLSAYFVLSLSIIVICVSLYSIGYNTHYIGKRNVGLLLLLNSTFILSMVLVFISANTVSFYISWEAMSLLSYFLVVFESEKEENQKAEFYILL